VTKTFALQAQPLRRTAAFFSFDPPSPPYEPPLLDCAISPSAFLGFVDALFLTHKNGLTFFARGFISMPDLLFLNLSSPLKKCDAGASSSLPFR